MNSKPNTWFFINPQFSQESFDRNESEFMVEDKR